MKIIDDKVVYVEIIDTLTYILNMKNLFQKLPKYNSNHLGTKHRSSSYKNLLKIQLNNLKDRLENPFFRVTNKDEISKIKLQIKFIEASLTKEYRYTLGSFNARS